MIYYGPMVSSSLSISVDKQMYCRRNETLARYINFSRVRVNSARMLLRSALSQGQVSIWQKDYQYIQIIMKTIIDGS